MKKTILAIAVAMFAQGYALESSAAVLTFESLVSAADNYSFATTYTEQGFKLDDITASGAGFSTWGTSSLFFSGSTALINDNSLGTTRLTQVGGGAFALNSIALVTLYPTFTPDGADVTFTGIKTDSTTVTQTFHVADAAVQTTFAFASGFTNLSAVTWTNDPNFHQFDNINVAAVPEPENYAMFLAGLGIMGLIARRRSK